MSPTLPYTIAEHEHVIVSGHELAVSAEQFDDRPAQIWIAPTNYVTDMDGDPVYDWQLTPAEARGVVVARRRLSRGPDLMSPTLACAVHPGRLVSFKGTGCPDCASTPRRQKRRVKHTEDYSIERSMIGIRDE
jgi:hypothetical protein